MDKVKLFCFPYAGGSSAIYSRWQKLLNPAYVEIKAIELAGRGRRMHESLYENVEEAIDDLYDKIKEDLVDDSYAFFGHSMGAMIAYELYQRIENEGKPLPVHIFFSGRGAPHIERACKQYHQMELDEFRREVLALGGTPPEFFNNPELVDIFLPLLKNDFKLAETAPSYSVVMPLECNISVLYGKEEDLSKSQIEGWSEQTKGDCQFYPFDGGHFFLHNMTTEINTIIQSVLVKYKNTERVII